LLSNIGNIGNRCVIIVLGDVAQCNLGLERS